MRRIAVVCSVLALASAALVPGAAAQTERRRPWPAEWPIVLPPTNRLPAHAPPAPPAEPATAAASRVLDVLSGVRTNLQRTRYTHHRVVNERRGLYYWDCSLMAHWVLERAAPRSVRHLANTQRPLAEHFVRTIERAPTDRSRRGWRQIEHIQDVRPGDVFAWRRPHGFPSRNTGHVGFVVGAPRIVPGIPNGWAVDVADATRGGHQGDTRPYPGDGGFGYGTLVFLTDGEGRGTHYGWAGTRSGGYVVTPILFGRVSR